MGIIAFLMNWNNFLFPLIVVNTTSMNVVSHGPLRFPDPVQHQLRPDHVGRPIAIVPILLVAILAQRQIVEGITLGAIQ